MNSMTFSKSSCISAILISIPLAFCLSSCGADKEEHTSSALRPSQTLKFSGSGEDLAVSKNFVAVAARTGGVKIFNTTNPSSITAFRDISQPFTYRVAMNEKTLFAIDEVNGLLWHDLNSENENGLNQALGTQELKSYVNDVSLVGNKLYAANPSLGITEISVDSPLNITTSDITHSISPNLRATHMASIGNYLIGIDAFGAASSLATDNPTGKAVSSVKTSFRPADISCRTGLCLVSDHKKGLLLLNVAESGKLSVGHTTTVDAIPTKLYLESDLAFVGFLDTKDRHGFSVYALEGKAKLKKRYDIPTPAKVKKILSDISNLYVLLEDGELLVYVRGAFKS